MLDVTHRLEQLKLIKPSALRTALLNLNPDSLDGNGASVDTPSSTETLNLPDTTEVTQLKTVRVALLKLVLADKESSTCAEQCTITQADIEHGIPRAVENLKQFFGDDHHAVLEKILADPTLWLGEAILDYNARSPLPVALVREECHLPNDGWNLVGQYLSVFERRNLFDGGDHLNVASRTHVEIARLNFFTKDTPAIINFSKIPNETDFCQYLTNLKNTSLNIKIKGISQRHSMWEKFCASLSGNTNIKKIKLDVSHCALNPDCVVPLAKLKNLTSLDISDNQLGDAGATPITKLTNLSSLIISNNRIGKAGAAEIAKLTNLTSLEITHDLWDDDLVDDDDYIFPTPDLAGIMLDPAEIDNLMERKSMERKSSDIRNKDLADGVATAIAKLTNLTSLRINYRDLSEVGVAQIAKLTNLRSLDTANSRLGDGRAAQIAKLKDLESLDISYNELGVAGAMQIAKLTNLRSLNISDNQLGDEGAAEIAKLTNLRSLKINGNRLSEEGTAQIAKLTNLESLASIEVNLIKNHNF